MDRNAKTVLFVMLYAMVLAFFFSLVAEVYEKYDNVPSDAVLNTPWPHDCANVLGTWRLPLVLELQGLPSGILVRGAYHQWHAYRRA